MSLKEQSFFRSKWARVLAVLFTYLFLLLLSYGFPVTADDWLFTKPNPSGASILDPFRYGLKTAKHHYITTNGRLLGNFLVAFTGYSKIVRELIRCGLILLVFLQGWRLVQGKTPIGYLLLCTLCIAIPANVAAETYAWAAGFFNYIPPTLCCLLYFNLVTDLYRGEKPEPSLWLLPLYLLLGFCSQLFMENFTISLCVLSLVMLLLLWKIRKRFSPVLVVHLFGTILGLVLMFSAPGYRNVNVEGYRAVSLSFADLYAVAGENFRLLSWYLITDNKLLILPISASCLILWGRYLSKQQARSIRSRSMAYLWIVLLTVYPIFSHGMHMIGRYLFVLHLAGTVLYFLSLYMTVYTCIKDRTSRFVLFLLLSTFLLFISPLMVVSPVGARNVYFFQLLLVFILLILLRHALEGFAHQRILSVVLASACCMLLLGNLWIYYRNGKCEQYRNRIVSEAMERGDKTITLPSYPYSKYVHSPGSEAIKDYYYYEKPGDITFYLITYKEYVSLHPDD